MTAKTPSGVTTRWHDVPPVRLEAEDCRFPFQLENHRVGIDDDAVGLEVAGDLQLGRLARFRGKRAAWRLCRVPWA